MLSKGLHVTPTPHPPAPLWPKRSRAASLYAVLNDISRRTNSLTRQVVKTKSILHSCQISLGRLEVQQLNIYLNPT